MPKPKILIIGHKQHGKDSVAALFESIADFRFTSSSMFVLEECIWDDWGSQHYATKDLCYADRDNHRPEWYNRIAAYNTPDKTRTASTMFARGFDLYVGMRAIDEYLACKEADIFEHVVWVDASERKPLEPETSFTIKQTPDMEVIDNNGPEERLPFEVTLLLTKLGIPYE